MKNIFLAATMLGGILLTACNPNEDIYNKLDDASAQKPYTELNVPYTINDADYALAGNSTITKTKTFNDTLPPDVFIPKILTKKFVALKEGSTIAVTYNYVGKNPSFTDKTIFAYEMDAKDYDVIGGNVGKYDYFSTTDSAKNYLPAYLLTVAPKAKSNDTLNVTFKFKGATTTTLGETYKFNGTTWSLVREFKLLEFIGYALFPSDYYQFGGNIAYNSNFSADFPAEKYLPGFLRWKYPVAVTGDFKILGYKFYDSGLKKTFFNTAKYVYDGSKWQLQANTDQYLRKVDGWYFDRTIRFKMGYSDYDVIVKADPLKDSYGTAGYTYGASIYKSNFDLRVNTWKNYDGARFNGMNDDQAKAFINDQVKKGIILLLQTKYPNAQPIVGGVESYFVVTFETYNNDLSRSYPTYKFQCTAAGSPATFVFVEAVQ